MLAAILGMAAAGVAALKAATSVQEAAAGVAAEVLLSTWVAADSWFLDRAAAAGWACLGKEPAVLAGDQAAPRQLAGEEVVAAILADSLPMLPPATAVYTEAALEQEALS